jgi:succinyl-CoA synthetase beta subunit
LKLHEYQAKELLQRFGVPVPRGSVAHTAAEAEAAAVALGGPAVIKAQAHTGARGKAGGIKVVDDPAAARLAAEQILGMQLVTRQTGPGGLPVSAVLVEERISIERELYLSVAIDNSAAMPVVIASAAGGMDIEEVAAERPDEIHREHVDPTCGFQAYQARALCLAIGLDGDLLRPGVQLITALVSAFEASDGSIAEINPLAVTADGRLLAGDAKLSIDDNAGFRQADLIGLLDRSQEPARELQAHDAGIDNYVKLDGNIGCLVNGAGLAMATMDAIKFEGGEPANFLDIGTANKQESVVAALEIIGADPDVSAVLINIFGGLARTDVIAAGLVAAKEQGLLPQPTVVRLAGTNFAKGTAILDDSAVELIRADGFAEAARQAVAAAGSAGAVAN